VGRVGRLTVASGISAALVAVASASAWPQQVGQGLGAGCTPSASWGTVEPDQTSKLLALVNAHRTAQGLAPLALSSPLSAAAVWKARHMAAFGYIDTHDPAPPVARSFASRLAACGYPGFVVGENLAEGYDDASGVLAAWLASPDLRSAVESPAFTITGIAAARGSDGLLYWVEEFAARAKTASGAARCHVPSVLGRTVTLATRALRQARCRLGSVSRAPSSRVPRGRVVAQKPRAGATLASRSPVDLVVSSGPRP
jgi:uncharacterized protein YkwD